MNYWKILESMNGLPTENMWNALWGSGGGSGEIEYVGAVPFSVIAKGGNASEWSLYGAGPYQEWTPSPEKERTANLLDVKEIYPPNAFTYSGEEITAINTAFAQTRINLSSYIGKTLTFSAEIKKESGITRAYLRANIGGEIIDSADILKNSEYTYVSITFTPKTSNDNVGITYGSGTNQMSAMHIMLNEGSTALPYEPYGYREKTGPCEVKGVGDRTGNLLDESTLIPGLLRSVDFDITQSESYKERYRTIKIYLKAGTYIVSGDDVTYVRIVLNGNYGSTSRPLPYTFTQNEDGYFGICVRKTDQSESEGWTPHPIMINEGSEPLPYEPYEYKTTVIDSGKNLFDKSTAALGYEINSQGISVNKSWFVTDYMHIHKLATIYRYINVGNSILLYDKDKKEIGRTQFSGAGITSVKINNPDCEYIRCNSTIENIDKYMISEEPITDFTPYRKPTTATIYTDDPLFSGDYVSKDSTGGKEHREWVKHVCTGNESLGRSTAYGDYAVFRILQSTFPDMVYNNSQYKCTHFPKGAGRTSLNDKEFVKYNSSNDNTMLFRYDALSTVAEFADYLKAEYEKGTPLIIYYRINTPIDTPKDLPEILLVNGYNGIDTDTQIKPEKMTLTYRVGKETAEADARLTAEFLNMMEEM